MAIDKKNEDKSISSNKASELNFLELYRIFWINKKAIVLFTLSITVIATLIVFFVIKPVFLSEGTVKASTQQSGLGALLGGGIPDIGELSDLSGIGSSSKELALYESILLSRRCIEETIIKFNMNEEWDYKYMQDAVKYFREEIIEITKDRISGLLTVGVFDENPEKSKEINAFLISQLVKIYTELSIQDARNNREFIQERYELVKKDLKKAEDSLKVFQEIYGLAPDLTVQAAIKTEVEIEAQIASEEVKLDLLKKILSPDQAEIKAQEEKISSLRKQASNIQNSSDFSSLLSLKGKPQVLTDYLRLKRDVEIQSKILAFILPLFEQAKIEENKEIPPVVVLDQPSLPERKAKPKRIKFVLIFTGLSFFAAYAWFFLRNRYRILSTAIKGI